MSLGDVTGDWVVVSINEVCDVESFAVFNV
jgi:hypothetical protein